MNFIVYILFGFFLIINGNLDQFNEHCQELKCNTTREICQINPNCNETNIIKCIYCVLKMKEQDLSVAPRLLAKSGGQKLLADNHKIKLNLTTDESSYDEYYEYEDDDDDKNEFGEEDDYLDDYIEPFDTVIDRLRPIRKLGVCPKIVDVVGQCDIEKISQSDCRFDTDCPRHLKCCESACGKRLCNEPIETTVSRCSTSFECSLNCRLGYQIDSNGCLKCECQSCPSVDKCFKNCPTGYLKDLFGCDLCECNERCETFNCNILCPAGVGFAQSENGCPLCQCALSKLKPIEHTSLCQENVHCPPGFRCLNDARNVPMCQAVSGSKNECAKLKCRTDCGKDGYKFDNNGCQTCECVSKENVQCSRVMCRMFCQYGFKRDENGCEYCSCNDSPQPCPELNCQKSCTSGFRKDYSGCQTCECNDREEKAKDKCVALADCKLDCKHGLQRDQNGCQLCSCSRCPLRTCRMYCMYGFRKNDEGCEVCECDWAPVADKVQCDERIPCQGTRVCNLKLKLCETVDPDKVNWFLYDFEVKTDLFDDPEFVQIFKSDLINNIASKYGLKTAQIAVSSVEQNGLTSFQIMPFFTENMPDFDKKMEQIDLDLNSHEFRSVLPSVVREALERPDKIKPSSMGSNKSCEKFKKFLRLHAKLLIIILVVLLLITGIFITILHIKSCQQHINFSKRSESKLPIYDTTYSRAPTDDDHLHAVQAPDGTTYVTVAADDKRALV